MILAECEILKRLFRKNYIIIHNIHTQEHVLFLSSQKVKKWLAGVLFSPSLFLFKIRTESFRPRNECGSPHTNSSQHKSIHGNPYLFEVLICIYKVIFFYILFQQKTWRDWKALNCWRHLRHLKPYIRILNTKPL